VIRSRSPISAKVLRLPISMSPCRLPLGHRHGVLRCGDELPAGQVREQVRHRSDDLLLRGLGADHGGDGAERTRTDIVPIRSRSLNARPERVLFSPTP
jgi:hypothetical protein